MSFPPVASLGYRTGFNFILSRRTVYPELFAVVGARTPDFRGQFLRGLDTGRSVGDRVQDTFKSHAHGHPPSVGTAHDSRKSKGGYQPCRVYF